MKPTEQNRNESYRNVAKLGEKQQIVLNTISSFKTGLTDKAIANILGWEINRVTGRRSELLSMGLIEVAGSLYDDKTNRSLTVFRLTEKKETKEVLQPTLF